MSTAYSNADKREIEETIYESPHDPHTIINCVETLSNETLNQMTEKLQVHIVKDTAISHIHQKSPNWLVPTRDWREPKPQHSPLFYVFVPVEVFHVGFGFLRFSIPR